MRKLTAVAAPPGASPPPPQLVARATSGADAGRLSSSSRSGGISERKRLGSP